MEVNSMVRDKLFGKLCNFATIVAKCRALKDLLVEDFYRGRMIFDLLDEG